MNHFKKIEPNNKSFKQGYFSPQNPEKYRGDIRKIFYRSSWEKIFMIKYCDMNPNCVAWSSEEIQIPYLNPIDKKVHNYIVDFFCILKQENDKNIGVFIEIKPEKELSPPVLKESKRSSIKRLERYNKEMAEYIKNISKWDAAKNFAYERGCKFLVLTEKTLGIR